MRLPLTQYPIVSPTKMRSVDMQFYCRHLSYQSLTLTRPPRTRLHQAGSRITVHIRSSLNRITRRLSQHGTFSLVGTATPDSMTHLVCTILSEVRRNLDGYGTGRKTNDCPGITTIWVWVTSGTADKNKASVVPQRSENRFF